MAATLPERPILRPLEVHRVTEGDERGVVLVDPLGLNDEQVFVPEGLLPLVGRMDGQRTCDQILAELRAEFGEVDDDAVVRVVGDLDQRLLLQSPRYETAVREAAAALQAMPARPPATAGSAGYPAESQALRAALASMVRRPENPTRPCPRALVAPHIDLARGREGYAQAYGYLAECEPAELYVVFGTGHRGPSAPLTGLSTDWQTPIGTLRTDRGVIDAVHAETGAPAPHDVLLHRTEHSIELQMLFLTHLFGDRDIAVAGFLTGALGGADDDPAAAPGVEGALRALRRIAGERRVCFIAGADLAHIGTQFGDPQPADADRLAALEATERERLQWLTRGDPRGFHQAVVHGDNPDRVCGASPIYLAASLASTPAELLHYEQAVGDRGGCVVSFCSAAFQTSGGD